ncbi:MAG: phosphoribosylformylglycinamidine cyclo-ligase [Candidatus Parvarchaeota archaeon]|nr:phosphoribosylformylglycinamidine cyclo-ligase [Candidatus Jingweiarchaeum tengchongense]
MNKCLSYSKLGIDIKKIKGIHDKIHRKILPTFDRNVIDIGQHYASLIKIGGKLIALHCDGVGTKVLIAQILKNYRTIGIDCIAMNVNDLICIGAKPISFLDYIALERVNKQMINEIFIGLRKGAKEARVSIIGGEMAIMPDMIKGINGNGFDLVGFAIGFLDKKELITGDKMRAGDLIIGLRSSGIHSNGLTLARKVFFGDKIDRYKIRKKRKILEELIKPTKIYVKPILALLKNCKVNALAHITGGAFSKLRRLGKRSDLGFYLDNLFEPQPIFKLIQKYGKLSQREMYRTFNMGTGFLVILPKEELKKTMSVLQKFDLQSRIVGKVIKEKKVILKSGSKEIVLEEW